MKILVFDDNASHRDAALAQLAGHDLTVVATYDEAQKLVCSKMDYRKRDAILKAQFGDFNPWECTEVQKTAYAVAEEEATEQATYHPDFDAVLVDLLVPASRQAMGDEGMHHVGKEMPIGAFIALLAAKNGAKYAAVLMDSSHHDHPASACFDAFNTGGEIEPDSFMVNSCKVIFCNNRNWVTEYDPSDLAAPLKYDQYKGRTDTVRAKNWSALLEYLVK